MICVLSSRFRQFIANFIVSLVVPDISFLHFIHSFPILVAIFFFILRSSESPVIANKNINKYLV